MKEAKDERPGALTYCPGPMRNVKIRNLIMSLFLYVATFQCDTATSPPTLFVMTMSHFCLFVFESVR